MYLSQHQGLDPKIDEHMSEVQATYYSFLEDQSQLKINLKGPKPQAPNTFNMVQVPSGLLDDSKDKEPNYPETKGEHLVPHMMKYIFDCKIGVLPYKV